MGRGTRESARGQMEAPWLRAQQGPLRHLLKCCEKRKLLHWSQIGKNPVPRSITAPLGDLGHGASPRRDSVSPPGNRRQLDPSR